MTLIVSEGLLFLHCLEPYSLVPIKQFVHQNTKDTRSYDTFIEVKTRRVLSHLLTCIHHSSDVYSSFFISLSDQG